MTLQTILMLSFIGLVAGAMSGFVGIGGGVIIVPALIYIMGMSQHEAQGTSLLLMLPPIGILAVMNYAKAGELNWKFGAIIAVTFVVGGYFGSKLSLKLSPALVKMIFGILMLYISVRMIYSGYKGGGLKKNDTTHSTTIETDT
ncbi:sulfite exporter TauE/SafE family protein [Paracrocinitomix mangrovi]|uniref:sulfite exporter TauE/SafE family protein n=1 Tax=Paracrocinitomix mangrovi TaxID=2862509 RepID=UPI001C8D0C06|nr:sulfite exporter TauE/SafE family protein [Paracrocinitomix mangrovi]UKN01871.1 sulfite exporter TauE/SafE family protein [Paracrocinitomix mangrovi]